MKKSLSAFLSVTLAVLMGLAAALFMPITAKAAMEITFEGKATDKTTGDVLYLQTSGGTVEIKIDSNTDTSEAKFIFKGDKVIADCYRGDDEYWHASKVKSDNKSENADVDKGKSSTVRGKIAKGTTSSKIYLKTNSGTMEIKVDESTDLSKVKYLVIDKKVEIVCARGSDAYMHAISVSDSEGGGSMSTINAKGTEISGKVVKGTTTSNLILKTSDGNKEYVLDVATDATECRVLIPDEHITAFYYKGNDSKYHISKLINDDDNCASTVETDKNTNAVVSGRVTSETTEEILFLELSNGIMEIKLDSTTNFSRCPVIVHNTNLKVECERGNDGYYHAKSIIVG
ncbi:MAG: hypothetical protein IKO84_12725 [Butyrivibrio sp.]|nr:hypothetical protein [Butyrivibrio sp.]